MGLLIAVTVAHEKIAAAAGGAVFALLQLAASLGLDVSQDKIAMIGSGLTALLASGCTGR